jgi:hypothetical protein
MHYGHICRGFVANFFSLTTYMTIELHNGQKTHKIYQRLSIDRLQHNRPVTMYAFTYM